MPIYGSAAEFDPLPIICAHASSKWISCVEEVSGRQFSRMSLSLAVGALQFPCDAETTHGSEGTSRSEGISSPETMPGFSVLSGELLGHFWGPKNVSGENAAPISPLWLWVKHVYPSPSPVKLIFACETAQTWDRSGIS